VKSIPILRRSGLWISALLFFASSIFIPTAPANAVNAPTVSSLTITSAITGGGTISVINGTNLDNATGVTVGGSAASIDTNTSTTISIRTPVLSVGVKDVVVTTAGGSVTKTGGITIYSTLTPSCGVSGYFTISNNKVSTNTACKGSVIIPSGVTDLGIPGFSYNLDITAVYIPATLKTIEPSTTAGIFYKSSVSSVTFEPGGQLTTISQGTFRQAYYLSYLKLPSNITTLEFLAFADYLPGIGLKWIEIPSSVTTINTSGTYGALNYDVPLTCIVTPANNSIVRSLVFGGNLTTITHGTFRKVTRLAYIDLPSNITTLESIAFSDYLPGSNLRWIRIPSSVTNIDTSSAYGALKGDVPLTCIITPADNTLVRSLTFISQYGIAATPNFVTDIASCPAPTVSSVSPSSGSTNGGTSLTLNGTNLFTVTGVTVGGVSATILSQSGSNTSMTIRTPPGASGSPQGIALTTPGPSNASASTFTYLEPPTYSSISVTSGSTLGGTVDTITGTNLTSATVKVGGVSATSVVATATTVRFTTPAGTAGTKDIVITTPVDSVTAVGVFTYIAPPSSSVLAPTVSGPALRTSVITLTVSVNTPGTARFMYNGRLISGCASRPTTGSSPNYQATCLWKPILQGTQGISALFTPTDISYGVATSPITSVSVLKRTTPR